MSNSTPIELSKSKRLIVTIALIGATLMQGLDTTIVNVALPEMQGSFSVTPDEISWILTSYLVASAIFIPLTGFFSDTLGRKRYLLLGIFGFTSASILCGFASTLSEMVIFRLFQGLAGAGLLPLSQAILADIYPPSQRSKAMAIWGMSVVLGPVLGPTIGGYLTEYMNWRWNFYINIPIGIFAAFIIWHYLDESTIKKRSLDWIGLVLLAVGIGSLQFTLDRGNIEDWFESQLICTTIATTVIALSGFVYYSIYHNDKAIFEVQIFKDRNFTISSIIMSFMGMGMFGSMIIQPIMLNSLFDYPPSAIGLSMAPRGAASLVSMYMAGKLLHKFPARNIVMVGILICTLGNYMATFYNLYLNELQIILPVIVQGFGVGLIFIPLSAQCLATLPAHFLSEATGLFGLLRVIGFSAGISIIITYFTRQTQANWNEMGGLINQYNPDAAIYLSKVHLTVTDPISARIFALELGRQAEMQAVVNVFYLITLGFICMLPLVFLLGRENPNHIEGGVVEM